MSRVLAPSNLVLVAGFEGRILGFSHSGPPDDGSKALEIFAFYCHPEAWGSGLADVLMHETCAVLSTAAQSRSLSTCKTSVDAIDRLRAGSYGVDATTSGLHRWTDFPSMLMPAGVSRRAAVGTTV